MVPILSRDNHVQMTIVVDFSLKYSNRPVFVYLILISYLIARIFLQIMPQIMEKVMFVSTILEMSFCHVMLF